MNVGWRWPKLSSYDIIRTNVPVEWGEIYDSKQGVQVPHLPKQKTN